MRMNNRLCLCAVALASLCGGLAACSSSSAPLTIVHFNQTILGDSAKDLGVSIGIKKGDDELCALLNDALSGLSEETRTTMMLEATDRSGGNYSTTVTTPSVVPTEGTVGTLTIGMECDYAPFNWAETKANDYTYPVKGTNLYADGYDVQIARYLASTINYSLEIVQLKWDALIPALKSGTINAVVAGMTDDEERRQSIDFTNEYYRSELVLVVREDSAYANATSLEEFAGARIVSQVSTVTNDIIEDWVEPFGITHLNPLDTFSTCAIAVRNKTADAMTAEYPVACAIVGSSRA